MSGRLFVVATPIGNLEDVTLRALRVLREVDLIAAEDTRRTARLLARHAISTPSLSFHRHNTRRRLPELMSRLHSGAQIAMVSDAGTPGISDPGLELIQSCLQANVAVEPVPGATAPLAAAVVSGFSLIPLTVFGFPPNRSQARIDWLSYIYETKHTFTFFESPLRIVKTLREASLLSGDRPIMIAREVTKIHEDFYRGTARSIAEDLPAKLRGEITAVVGPEVQSVSKDQTSVDQTADVAGMFSHLTKSCGLSRRDAIRSIARETGASARSVYAALEATKPKGVRCQN